MQREIAQILTGVSRVKRSCPVQGSIGQAAGSHIKNRRKGWALCALRERLPLRQGPDHRRGRERLGRRGGPWPCGRSRTGAAGSDAPCCQEKPINSGNGRT